MDNNNEKVETKEEIVDMQAETAEIEKKASKKENKFIHGLKVLLSGVLDQIVAVAIALGLYGLIVMFSAFMSTTVPTLFSSTNFAYEGTALVMITFTPHDRYSKNLIGAATWLTTSFFLIRKPYSNLLSVAGI